MKSPFLLKGKYDNTGTGKWPVIKQEIFSYYILLHMMFQGLGIMRVLCHSSINLFMDVNE